MLTMWCTNGQVNRSSGSVISRSLLVIATGYLALFNAVPNVEAIVTDDSSVQKICDFPGVAVLLPDIPNALISCTGVVVGNNFIMPDSCMATLTGMITVFDMVVNDGINKWTFAAGSTITSTKRTDGTRQVSLTSAQRAVINSAFTSCPKTAILYDGSEDLNTDSCRLVGFGASTNVAAPFDVSNLRAAKIEKSYSAKCCQEIVIGTLSDAEKGLGYKKEDTFNCIKSSGSPCGLSDVGAPVMCDTVRSEKVILGIAASFPCDATTTIIINDLTGQSDKTKFGI